MRDRDRFYDIKKSRDLKGDHGYRYYYDYKNSNGYKNEYKNNYKSNYKSNSDHRYNKVNKKCYDYRYRRSSRYKRKEKSFVLGLALVVIALAIVVATKTVPDDSNDFSPSYGYQDSVYKTETATSQNKEKKLPLISQEDVEVGTKIDEYKGVAVYSNGKNYLASNGLNFSDDGYYFGYKWQCVEFVKRFYYEQFNHEMPDGAGHAKYFFNPLLEQGELNEQRGLYQYKNGGDVKPREDDLLVFDDGSYGHVAIISAVGDNWLEVVQQNSEFPREKYQLIVKDGTYTVEGDRNPVGWLRK
jgi:hypothetical protein